MTIGLHVLALCAPALASQTQPLFPEQTKRVIAWPDVPSLAKGRMVVGDVTGDLHADAVLLNGGRPVVVYAPAIHQAVFELDEPAHDLEVLPGTGPGGSDSLVLVGPQGLKVGSVEAGAFAGTSLGGPDWVDAQRVRAADVDGDGEQDLVGLSDQDELLFLEDVFAPFPLETIRPIGEPVLDYVPIDWAGEGERAVAVLTGSGLSVRTKAGATLFALPGDVDGGFLAVLRQANASFERLVLVYEAFATQFLLVLDRDGIEEPLPLWTDTVFGLAVADADLDLYEDLYLLHRVSHHAVLFLNQAGDPSAGATFAPGAGELVNVAPGVAPAPGWSAWPALADLSRDGDPETLVFVEATGEFVLVENARLPLAHHQVQIHGGTYVLREHGSLYLEMSAPQLPFEPTHVEIVGWRQTDADGVADLADHPADPDAVTHDFFELDEQNLATSEIELDESDLFTPHVYYFDIRAVRVEDGSVTAAGPSAVHAFTTPQGLVDELEDTFGTGTVLRVIVFENGLEIRLTDEELADRVLAPKEIQTDTIPPIDTPNPFD